MAEPTLSNAYSDVRAECGWEAGWGRDSSSWSTDQLTHIAAAQKAALTQAYYPPNGHRWKFLRPLASFSTWRTLTGTVSGTPTYDSSTGLTTFTATASVFHNTDPGHTLTYNTSSTAIADGYTSGTVITVQGDVSAATGSFSIAATDTYRAPDDFDALVGRMMFSNSSAQGYAPIEQISLEHVVWLQDSGVTGIPKFVALKPVTNLAGQQRWDFVLYPEPDSAYTLSYRYRINPDNLTSSATAHYGGVWFSQLLLASARSAMEFEMMREHGPRHADFMEKLAAATSMDRDTQAQTLGYVGDGPMNMFNPYYRLGQTVTLDYP